VIERIGVVVPAHDEEELLPACLDALAVARTRVGGLGVHVVVVLDRCSDGSRAVAAARPWVEIVTIDAGNVGAARAAGVETILRRFTSTPLDRLWLATTDADSVVPVGWLAGQVDLADAGWEVVVGTVTVADWSDHPAHVSPSWLASYQAVEHHPHVHGANLGCTAEAYLAVGGWAPLAADEDVALVNALSHRRVRRTAALAVTTSARRDPRAAGGFGDTLSAIAG
jgi:glycosyltransferase involved in cell wall biosynthesis